MKVGMKQLLNKFSKTSDQETDEDDKTKFEWVTN
jgi:hypothetical protein